MPWVLPLANSEDAFSSLFCLVNLDKSSHLLQYVLCSSRHWAEAASLGRRSAKISGQSLFLKQTHNSDSVLLMLCWIQNFRGNDHILSALPVLLWRKIAYWVVVLRRPWSRWLGKRTSVLRTNFSTIAGTWKPPTCPPIEEWIQKMWNCIQWDSIWPLKRRQRWHLLTV